MKSLFKKEWEEVKTYLIYKSILSPYTTIKIIITIQISIPLLLLPLITLKQTGVEN